MSKKAFKSHASSDRISTGFGGLGTTGFGSNQTSVLSHVQEPLDYSLLSDSSITVAFKNLSKKDGTTKSKALEDLQTYVTSLSTEIDEGLLQLWVRLVSQ